MSMIKQRRIPCGSHLEGHVGMCSYKSAAIPICSWAFPSWLNPDIHLISEFILRRHSQISTNLHFSPLAIFDKLGQLWFFTKPNQVNFYWILVSVYNLFFFTSTTRDSRKKVHYILTKKNFDLIYIRQALSNIRHL